MTDQLKPGDIVRFGTTHSTIHIKYRVVAVVDDRAWITEQSTKDVWRDRVVWVVGLVKVDL